MSHSLAMPTINAENIELGECDQEFDNPFEDQGDVNVSNNNNDNTSLLDDHILAEEGRFLLDSFMDDDRNNASKYPMSTPRSRTASEPMIHPLMDPSDVPATTATPRKTSLSRRRGVSSSSNVLYSSAPSIGSISTTSTTSSARGSSQRTLPSSSNNSAARHGVIEEESDERRMRRSSLDAGMAAVRRWIRSRSSGRTGASNSHSNRVEERRYSEILTNNGANSRVDNDDDDLMFFETVNQAGEPETSTASTARQQHRQTIGTSIRTAPPTILEVQGRRESNDYRSPRQRALSEPDAAVRDFLFQRALTPHRGFRRLRYSRGDTPSPANSQQTPPHPRAFWSRNTSNDSNAMLEVSALASGTPRMSGGSSPLSSSAVEVLFTSSPEADSGNISIGTPTGQDDQHGNIQSSNSMDNNSVVDSGPDPQREARARWRLINRRFQVVITVVALIFSLLLFAILVCWVILTSAYVVSIDKYCDVPLKAYFWLATLQLILDVFRTDIMRCIFRWDANSNQRIPSRVITYNIAYLTYACLVLRMGIHSVFVRRDAECRTTASELYKASTMFVSLSIAAWSTIILGYLFPFCVVATLLTLNGYTPSSDSQRDGATGPVFPTPMGAPPGCVDRLRTVRMEDITSESARECCICMEHFTQTDTIVETECNHRYHKNCLADWLRQARTCPVCRMDVVPSSRTEEEDGNEESEDPSERARSPPTSRGGQQQQQNHARIGLVPATRTFGRNTDIHHEVVSLFQIIRRSEMRNRQNLSGGNELRNRSGSIEIRNRSMSQHEIVEDGHNGRQY